MIKQFSKPFISNESLVFAIILLLSVPIYLFNINFSDIWIDESFTKELISHSFSDMLTLIKDDFHPPLYFYGLKLFVCLVGNSICTIRLFSVIGALSTVIITYTVGHRVLGKKGALYFCLLFLSLPMIFSFSHEARMYTWAAFSIMGVFIYSFIFIKTGKKIDLLLLGFFSLLAAYIHYFALIGSFFANLFVLLYLFRSTIKTWVVQLYSMFVLFLLYLPWLSIFLRHTAKAQHHFWIPPISWEAIGSLFIAPFSRKLWLPTLAIPLMIIVYGMTFFAIYQSFIKRKDGSSLALRLSLFVFIFTILTTGIISLLSQPILTSRYIMPIIPMLIIPPTIYLTSINNFVVRFILLATIITFGISISLKSSFFSYGPYKQSLEYVKNYYPEIKKILHIVETTTGPLLEYNNLGHWDHYWLDNENTTAVTNMEVFDKLHKIKKMDSGIDKGETFCLVIPQYASMNIENLNLVLTETKTIDKVSIVDNKVKFGGVLFLFILKDRSEK